MVTEKSFSISCPTLIRLFFMSGTYHTFWITAAFPLFRMTLTFPIPSAMRYLSSARLIFVLFPESKSTNHFLFPIRWFEHPVPIYHHFDEFISSDSEANNSTGSSPDSPLAIFVSSDFLSLFDQQSLA
ncbi:unnamed protein product [Vicia faba]|uniref:Uncharacterized protein n=1 Tax=Vicia faba TaxID=3906 RepID=A0AAV0YKR5_VICFA|nr:unnamed protein product [Vicia faba]